MSVHSLGSGSEVAGSGDVRVGAARSVPVEAQVQSRTLTDPGNSSQIVRFGALVLAVMWSDGKETEYRIDKRPTPLGRRYRSRCALQTKTVVCHHPDVNDLLKADGVPLVVERSQDGRISLRSTAPRESSFSLLGVEGQGVESLTFEPAFILRS